MIFLIFKLKPLILESVIVFQRQYLRENTQMENRIIDGYLVGEDGNINMPIIGVVNTNGKSTYSLALEIQEALSPYVKNPSVNIRILNFRVSVLGEVQTQARITVMEERISIPQALGLAGDLTINGDRNKCYLLEIKTVKVYTT